MDTNDFGFREFGKIARLSRSCVVTEKIDGTNAQIWLVPRTEIYSHHTPFVVADLGELLMFTGSRTRWITPTDDNFGFSKWALAHAEQLLKLGPGRHFGEWWGQGIQRTYGLKEKRFSLFNTSRWVERTSLVELGDKQEFVPECCHVVPVLYSGLFHTYAVEDALMELKRNGSHAAPGFMRPEGVVTYHVAGNSYWKKTIEKDDEPKSKSKNSLDKAQAV